MSILKRIGAHKDKFELEVQVHSISAKLKPGLYKLIVKASRKKKLETGPVQYNLNSGKIILEFPVRFNISMYKKSSKYLNKKLSLKLIQLSSAKLLKNGKGSIDMAEIALTNIGLFRHDVPLKKCTDKNASVNLTINLNPIEISSQASRSSSRTSSFAHGDESHNLKETGFFRSRDRSISVASSNKGSSKQTPRKNEAKNENEQEMSFTNYSEREQQGDDSFYDDEDMFDKVTEGKHFVQNAEEVESMAQAAPIAIFSCSDNESSDSDSEITGSWRGARKTPRLTLTSAKIELNISPLLDKSKEFVTPVKTAKPSRSLKIETKLDTHISPVIISRIEETEEIIIPKKESLLYTSSYSEQLEPSFPNTLSFNNQKISKSQTPNKESVEYTLNLSAKNESIIQTPTLTDKNESRIQATTIIDKNELRGHSPSITDKNITTQEEPYPFRDIPKPTTTAPPQAAIPLEFERDHSTSFSNNNQAIRKSLEILDSQASHIVDVDYDGSGSEISSKMRKNQTEGLMTNSDCCKKESLSTGSDLKHDRNEEIASPSLKEFVEIDNVMKFDYEELRKSIKMEKSSDNSSSEEEPIKFNETTMDLPITSMTSIKPNAFSKDEILEKNEFKSGIVGGNKRSSACTGCMIF